MPDQHQVAITYVSDSSTPLVDALIATIRALDNNNTASTIAIQADVAAPDAPSAIVNACLAAFGPTIDILVNNAGVAALTALAGPDAPSALDA